MEVITKSASETQKLGKKIGRGLKDRNIIALYGELGSGKTTFIQGLARGLGIKCRVISPTFVFVRQYPVASHPALLADQQLPVTFYHIDLYRIDTLGQTKGLGLEEIFADSNAIIAIEWAEKIEKLLPKKRLDIFFKYVDENERRIKIVKR